MPLPILCPPDIVARLLPDEAALLDRAASFLREMSGLGFDSIVRFVRIHVAAIAHLNEISYCHESDHPADREIHASLMQLKAFHLAALGSHLDSQFT